MSQIVDELRRMCAVEPDQYTVGGTAYWSDAHLQGVLDRNVSARLLQARVERIWTVSETGQQEVRAGQVQIPGTLDAEAALMFDAAGAKVEGAAIHPDGRIDFDSDQASLSLLLTGLAYDLNAAAGDVLTEWAAAVKGGYDISVDGQKLSRSQRHSQLLEQARTFRSKAVAGSVRLRRSDARRRRR